MRVMQDESRNRNIGISLTIHRTGNVLTFTAGGQLSNGGQPTTRQQLTAELIKPTFLFALVLVLQILLR